LSFKTVFPCIGRFWFHGNICIFIEANARQIIVQAGHFCFHGIEKAETLPKDSNL